MRCVTNGLTALSGLKVLTGLLALRGLTGLMAIAGLVGLMTAGLMGVSIPQFPSATADGLSFPGIIARDLVYVACSWPILLQDKVLQLSSGEVIAERMINGRRC